MSTDKPNVSIARWIYCRRLRIILLFVTHNNNNNCSFRFWLSSLLLFARTRRGERNSVVYSVIIYRLPNVQRNTQSTGQFDYHRKSKINCSFSLTVVLHQNNHWPMGTDSLFMESGVLSSHCHGRLFALRSDDETKMWRINCLLNSRQWYHDQSFGCVWMIYFCVTTHFSILVDTDNV